MVGLNVRVTLWSIDAGVDDRVGGAMLTGTPQYENLWARIEDTMPTQALLEQGLETVKLISMITRPATLNIQERDEVQVTFPKSHWLYNVRARVVGVQRDSRRDGHMELKLERITVSRANQG